MMVIRSSQVPAGVTPEPGHDADPLQQQAAELFAGQFAADRVPSVRAIRAQLHVGQPRRSGCQTASPPELQNGRKLPPPMQLCETSKPTAEAPGRLQRASNRRSAVLFSMGHVCAFHAYRRLS
jgi:hypothetical protein